MVPGVAAASTGRFLGTRWGEDRYTRGGYTSFAPGQLTRYGGLLWIDSEDPEERQEVAAGRLIFAGEHLSDAYYGFMNGAAETGRLAAELVVRRLAQPGASASAASLKARPD
jgi:monoamine oxidase